MDKYWVVTDDNLTELGEKTGWGRRYLRGELQDARYRDCQLVVFEAQGEWHKIFINNHYSVQWVMRELANRWGLNV